MANELAVAQGGREGRRAIAPACTNADGVHVTEKREVRWRRCDIARPGGGDHRSNATAIRWRLELLDAYGTGKADRLLATPLQS